MASAFNSTDSVLSLGPIDTALVPGKVTESNLQNITSQGESVFDGVVVPASINPQQLNNNAFSNISKVLKPGGRVVIKEIVLKEANPELQKA